MSDQESAYGQQTPGSSSSEFNAIMFAVQQLVARLNTAKLVKVSAVHAGSGAPPAAGTVDVIPLVNQVDGGGYPTKHGIIPGVPWFRLGSKNGQVIADPAVDDVGMIVCCDRDISKVKATRDQANPGSFRTYDAADGIYFGLVLAQTPTQWLRFLAEGLELVDKDGNKIEFGPTGVKITPKSGQNVEIAGPLKVNGGATIKRILAGSVTTNFGGTVLSLNSVSQNITVPGVLVGDYVVLGMSAPPNTNLTIVAYVSAPNTVTITVGNPVTIVGTQPITLQTYTVLVFGTI